MSDKPIQRYDDEGNELNSGSWCFHSDVTVLESELTRLRDALDLKKKQLDHALNALEAVRTNDATPRYEYGEKRKLDDATPIPGQRWATPFEISRDACNEIAAMSFAAPAARTTNAATPQKG